jgi:hypothetical protein
MNKQQCRISSGIARFLRNPDRVILGMRRSANNYVAPKSSPGMQIDFLRRAVEQSGRQVQVIRTQPAIHSAAMFGHPGTQQSGVQFS